VDNTDLLHIDLMQNKTVDEVHLAIQESVNSWENLLIATGGQLQPNKCFYSIVSFEWVNGEWRYVLNSQKGGLSFIVPLLGGGKADIAHRLVCHAENTLGVMTSLDGNSRAAIEMMREKAQK
jgi:hypothetical protein